MEEEIYEWEDSNERLRNAIGKQAVWIMSISEHYSEVQRQLLAINSSMLVVQKDFLHFFESIKEAK
jgi:hypothetical protein